MARGAWDMTASLAVLIAGPNRNEEDHPQPFCLGEFHPLRGIEEAETTSDVIPYDPAIFEAMQNGLEAIRSNGGK